MALVAGTSIWIGGYGQVPTGSTAAQVWIAGYGGPGDPANSTIEVWLASHGGNPAGGATECWIGGYGGPPSYPASPIWISHP